MKKTRIICSIIFMIVCLACVVINLYLVFARGESVCMIPACGFAAVLVFNSANLIKHL